MLTAAVYARYSSDLQRPTSVEDQVREQRVAADRAGFAVSHVCTDEEISGATGARPGYQRLLELGRAREIQAIFVESQDRLWRNQAEMHYALERFRFWGVQVIAASTGDLTNRTGRLVASVMGWKDEAFLDDLRDKTRRGMAGTIQRGLSAGGRTFGYRSEPVMDDAGHEIGRHRVIDPGEAEVVRYICRLYADDGLTPLAIAHRLNEERVPAPRTAWGRRSGSWTPSTITGSRAKGIGILRNPIYVGKTVWNRSQKVRDPDTGKRTMRVRPPSEWIQVDVPDLRIVPDDLWARVQARRERRAWTSDSATHGAKPKYLLSGLLKCGVCDGNYVVQFHRRGEIHYGCAVHHDRGRAVCANATLVRRDRIEQVTLGYVFGDLFTPTRMDYLTGAVNAALERAQRQAPDATARRAAALREANCELENVAAAIRQGIVTPTTRQMLEDAERRVAALEEAVRVSRRQTVPVVSVRTVVERYLRDLRATLDTNVEEARRLLSLAIDRIALKREGAHLAAEFCGNLAGTLRLEPDLLGCIGAGRGI